MSKFLDKYYYDDFIIPDLDDTTIPVIINGKHVIDGDIVEPLLKQFENDISSNLCPYCHVNILAVNKQFKLNNKKGADNVYALMKVWDCTACSFWKIFQYGWNYDSMASSIYRQLYSSKLKEFNDSLPEFFSEEMSVHLKRNPHLWYNLNPTSFEKYVTELFRANYDYSEVLHVGGPGDLGVDIYYISSKGQEWLIQVKRRMHPEYREPVKTVIHLLGSMTIKNSKKAIIVSTADRFTSEAVKLVAQMKQKDYQIELLDIGFLNRIINPVIPKNLPLQFLQSNQEDIIYFKEIFPREFKSFMTAVRKYSNYNPLQTKLKFDF